MVKNAHRHMKKRTWLLVLLLIFANAISAQKTGTFTNPLLPSGADPYSFYKDGFYYYTNTGGNRIVLWKTKNLADLKTAERKTIFQPNDTDSTHFYAHELWAPEVNFINGAWYCYFAADDGSNNNHRLYVLENKNKDPMQGNWEMKGKVFDPTNKWAIDADVFFYNNQQYIIWAGWEGDANGQQNIYIAKMKNPWTITGQRVCIAKPTYAWEEHGDLQDANNPPHVNVNEGPQALQHKGKLFIIFSASGCWTDYYALGLLSFKGKNNLLDASAWIKSPEPLFKASIKNGVYAPGHNSFFKSPNGKEDWILYHANDKEGQGCGPFRSPRAQRFTWNNDGSPFFGEPVKTGVPIAIPAER